MKRKEKCCRIGAVILLILMVIVSIFMMLSVGGY